MSAIPFIHMTAYPAQSACANRNCYCFMGTNPLDWPMDDDDRDSASSISCASSTTAEVEVDEFADLPPLIQAAVAPFLEPNPAPILDAEAPEFYPRPNDADNWAVTVNDIVFRHPRALLAYFRMVDLVNEVARYDCERIVIPPLSHDTCHEILNHISIVEPVEEFEGEIRDLYRYVVHYAA